MKIIKVALAVLALGIVSFGFYAYKLHALAVEGNKIFEYRCTTVNPPLIGYKNSFLKAVKCIKGVNGSSPCSEDEVVSSFNGYISGMKDYVPEEDRWLEMQKAYMNRWDFKLFEPWYIKQAGEYEWKMYEGYRDDAKGMLGVAEQGVKSEDAGNIQTEARNRRVEYEQRYFDFFDQAMEIKDWRKRFATIPISTVCTEENVTIPDTIGAFDEKPTPIPVERDTAS